MQRSPFNPSQANMPWWLRASVSDSWPKDHTFRFPSNYPNFFSAELICILLCHNDRVMFRPYNHNLSTVSINFQFNLSACDVVTFSTNPAFFDMTSTCQQLCQVFPWMGPLTQQRCTTMISAHCRWLAAARPLTTSWQYVNTTGQRACYKGHLQLRSQVTKGCRLETFL